ncbi:MAG TPA: hypothetical protein VGG72_05315 [Bryobacteraceae bacterium]
MAIKFGIHTGSGYNFDETVVLYARDSLQRVARINAQPSYEHGYDLRDLDAGKDDQAGARIIASGWVASNCTSNWNGNTSESIWLKQRLSRVFLLRTSPPLAASRWK